jgi:predicted amidohydrolase
MSRIVKIAACAVPWFTNKQSEAKQGDAMARAAIALVAEAGRRGADIVCLPEYCLNNFNFQSNRRAPLRSSAPTIRQIARLAAKHRMYVIAPMIEDGGRGKQFNTAMLFDCRGKLAGRYRKTHLCLPDISEGEYITAGDQLPVFKTDFGTIAITICMDIHYPELYAALALKGAEIIFWPTASIDYTGDLMESLVNARAIDNQVFFVCSHFAQGAYLAGKLYGRSRIVDPMGRIRADTGHLPGVAIAEVDLDQTYPMWYEGKMLQRYPTMRETIFKTRRPELYGELTKPVRAAHWKRSISTRKKSR